MQENKLTIGSIRRIRTILLILPVFLFSWHFARAQELVNPHGKLMKGLDCSSCHRSDTWKPTKSKMDFNHAKMTGFPLLGKHKVISCQSCHLNLKFDEPKVTASTCSSCHVDVHQGKLGDDCQSCHNETNFQLVDGRTIHMRTSFPLTGAHAIISCVSCHKTRRNGAFTPLSTSCYSCHEQDYLNAKSINHVTNNFSTNCTDCHSTAGWGSSKFDHVAVSGGFALLGAHRKLRCSSCHVPPSFKSKFPTTSDQDCYTCHTADYQRAHGSSGFPHTCTDCHNVNSWGGASFKDHDSRFFPIFSGTHKNTWSSCQTCHTDPANFKTFTCLSCHEHNKTTTDERHREVRGYVYESTACYSCHPTGRRGDD